MPSKRTSKSPCPEPQYNLWARLAFAATRRNGSVGQVFSMVRDARLSKQPGALKDDRPRPPGIRAFPGLDESIVIELGIPVRV